MSLPDSAPKGTFAQGQLHFLLGYTLPVRLGLVAYSHIRAKDRGSIPALEELRGEDVVGGRRPEMSRPATGGGLSLGERGTSLLGGKQERPATLAI